MNKAEARAAIRELREMVADLNRAVIAGDLGYADVIAADLECQVAEVRVGYTEREQCAWCGALRIQGDMGWTEDGHRVCKAHDKQPGYYKGGE